MKLTELNEDKKKKVTQMSSDQDDYDIGNFALNKPKGKVPTRWYHGAPEKKQPYQPPYGPFKGEAAEYESHLL